MMVIFATISAFSIEQVPLSHEGNKMIVYKFFNLIFKRPGFPFSSYEALNKSLPLLGLIVTWI